MQRARPAFGEDVPPHHSAASETALAALIDEHSSSVYRLARSIVSDPGLADDVTQETFIKVWKHLDEFRGEPVAVLYVAATGTAAAWHRRLGERVLEFEAMTDDPDSAEAKLDAALAAGRWCVFWAERGHGLETDW